jgi:beta-N-acetylhexosaminidase
MRHLLPFLLLLSSSIACAQPVAQGPTLDEKIGQMLMVGFRGTVATSDSSIARFIREYHLGSVIFFDVDVERMKPDRNVASPAQLKALVDSLQSFSAVPLFIAIDQEGGRVNRLKTTYGFPASVSAQYLGRINNTDSTRFYADRAARTLKSVGINVNFAPVVDVNSNPDNPVIGKLERSYSADPEIVATHARVVTAVHKEYGIVTTFKHFPGHGSAWNDSHVGMADVTTTWADSELIPYRRAIEANELDAIMTAHIFNANFDKDHPGTLSKRVLTGMLREELGFDGVIYSDDMQMKAVADFYGLEQAIELGINAGIDILTFGNNTHQYEPDIAERAFKTIKMLVETGRISEARIDESYQRIMKLKRSYGVIHATW